MYTIYNADCFVKERCQKQFNAVKSNHCMHSIVFREQRSMICHKCAIRSVSPWLAFIDTYMVTGDDSESHDILTLVKLQLYQLIYRTINMQNTAVQRIAFV